ncbi:MAG TPA: MlaD family protein [Candidatus Angelobacter sp.]|nr:MlaD family protein [Candidatus Angelobacter sp.]
MTTEAKVGAFVLGAFSLLAITLLYLINAGSRAGTAPYRTYLHYAGGLEPGDPVLFGGIKVGSVTGVKPWADDPTRIEVLVALKKGTPVNDKSVAKLGAISLMSGPALLVSTGSNDAHRIGPGGSIPSQEAVSMDELVSKVSTIADSANTLITQVQGELGSISGDARTVLANLNSLTGRPNQERISSMLEQTNRLVTDARPKIDHLMDQVSSVAAKLDPAVDHADKAIQNVNATVTDMRDPLRKDLTDLQVALQEAKGLLADMQVMVRANDSNIGEALENLRMTTENLNQLTNSVKQRPWSLIRIRQPQDRKVPE